MIQYQQLKDGNGKPADKIPICSFSLNSKQQIAVIGHVEATGKIVSLEDYPGYHSENLGRLDDDIGFIMQSQIINSLNKEGSDFKKFPNPDVLLICKIEESIITNN